MSSSYSLNIESATSVKTRFEPSIDICERLTAGTLLIAISPVLFILSVITAFLSGQFPLIWHERVGKQDRAIKVLKLRTMWRGRYPNRMLPIQPSSRESQHSQILKVKSDPRITSRYAALCRECSLDEVPQLWNVVRGDMSLVGPRPLTRQELSAHYGADAAEVLSVKPGITGLWQTRGRSRLSYHKRRRLDLFLVRHRSAKLYFMILLSTVVQVLRRADAW